MHLNNLNAPVLNVLRVPVVVSFRSIWNHNLFMPACHWMLYHSENVVRVTYKTLQTKNWRWLTYLKLKCAEQATQEIVLFNWILKFITDQPADFIPLHTVCPEIQFGITRSDSETTTFEEKRAATLLFAMMSACVTKMGGTVLDARLKDEHVTSVLLVLNNWISAYHKRLLFIFILH